MSSPEKPRSLERGVVTRPQSLLVRISRWEDDAHDLHYLRETRADLLDELTVCEKRLAAAERATLLLARIRDFVSQAEADVDVPAQEAAPETFPAGNLDAPAEVPETQVPEPEESVPVPTPEEAPESSAAEADPSPESADPAEPPTHDPAGTADAAPIPPQTGPTEPPTGTIREQLLELIGANPGMLTSDVAACLPHLNPATVAATISKLLRSGELRGSGMPMRYAVASAMSASGPEPAPPAPAPDEVPPVEAAPTPTPEPAPDQEPPAPDLPPISSREQILAFVEAHPHVLGSEIIRALPHINRGTVHGQLSELTARGELGADGSPRRYRLPSVPPLPPETENQTPGEPAAPPLPEPAPRPQPRQSPEPRGANLPRDLPPLPQAAVTATPVEVELVQGALKHQGRPMSKSLLLNRVIKSGIKSLALDDALAQLVSRGAVEEVEPGRFGLTATQAAV